jgi:hypothetical protein
MLARCVSRMVVEDLAGDKYRELLQYLGSSCNKE